MAEVLTGSWAASGLGLRRLPRWAYRDALLLTLLLLAASLCAFPLSTSPVGDDAAFGETAMIFARTGQIVYVGWGAMPQTWQLLWSAPFLHLFGYTFPVLGASTLPLALLSIALFHGVLVRFGVGRRAAALGTATLAFCPVFLPLATIYQTDVPGLLVILVCVAMCQMAVLSMTMRSACTWLIAAGVVNLILGSLRQICWLGVLLMVPSTSWLIARRLGKTALWVGLAEAAVSVPMILWIMHWFLAHPYTFAEKIIGPVNPRMLVHAAMQYVMGALLLVALLSPVAVRLMGGGRYSLSRAARMRIVGAVLTALAMLAAVARWRPVTMNKMIFPWLEPLLNNCGFPQIDTGVMSFGLGMRILISLAVVALGWYLLERAHAAMVTVAQPFRELLADDQALAAAAILGPYSLAYIVALAGRATFFEIQDRYLLLVLPSFLTLFLLALERAAPESRLQKRRVQLSHGLSIATLAFFAAISIAGSHSVQAYGSAVTRLNRRMEAHGIPRRAISEGFAADIQAQVVHGGHVNIQDLLNPANAYDPNVPRWDLPRACEVNIDRVVSRLHPVYYFSPPISPACFMASAIAPEPFVAWLPPFHREIRVLVQKPGTHREQEANNR